MASITVTPLNNGITTLGTLVGILPLNFGATTSYLYYDSLGDIYFQLDKVTPATLMLSSGFAINCKASIFDGSVFYVFLGCSGGNYIYGTIDPTGINTLATSSNGVDDITAVTFDLMSWAFTIGDSKGVITKFDISTSLFSIVTTLSSANLTPGAYLKISSINYNLTLDKYLISATATTNVQTNSPTNLTVSFFGTLDALNYYNFIGWNLNFCAVGIIEDQNGLKIPKLVVAGEDCKFYESGDGLTWKIASSVDQQLRIFSLTFNTWVFVVGLEYGILLLSTNGNVWESAYDTQLVSDILDVRNN